ncbi:phage/plasmid primase, P4 family [Singulisphaera rosea]
MQQAETKNNGKLSMNNYSNISNRINQNFKAGQRVVFEGNVTTPFEILAIDHERGLVWYKVDGNEPIANDISKIRFAIEHHQGGHPDFSYTWEKGNYEIVKRYRAAGLNVMPCALDGSKYPPKTQKWGKWKQQAISDSDLEYFWSPKFRFKRPFGICIPCGRTSGNLEVLDFDAKGLFEKWSALVEEASPGLVKRLTIHETPDFGHHCFYRCETIQGSQALAKSKSGENVLIETRGEGGLVVAPGSPDECHPLRKPYRLIQGTPDTIPTLSEDERETLLDVARTFNQFEKAPKPPRQVSRDGGEPEQDDPDTPWGDFNLRATWDEILEPHGWTLNSGDWENGKLTRPGKATSEGASATIGHCGNCLHVFSSSAEPFEQRTYSKAAAFALLEHGGDFQESNKALQSKGYGEQAKRLADHAAWLSKQVPVDPVAPISIAKTTRQIPDSTPGKSIKTPQHGTVVSEKEPVHIAKAIVGQLWAKDGERLLRRWNDNWWLWTGDRYEIQGEKAIRAAVYGWLEDARRVVKEGEKFVEKPFNPDSTKVNKVIDALESVCFSMVKQMPLWLGESKGLPSPDRIIATKNGLLDLDSYLDGQDCLLEHTPDWWSANCLPFEFQADAKCPTWNWFVNDVLDGDQESIETIQQWFGYNLVADTSQQKIMILTGSGRNGKGVLIRRLQRLLGSENYCTPKFSDLMDRFGLAHWQGKLAGIFADAHLGRETDAVRCLEMLKGISGEDSVDIQVKHKEALTGVKLNTRITIVTNELPKLPDSSMAIGKRLIVVPFHQSYEGREDITLEAKLDLELPGILNWALEGLRLLRERGKLSAPKSGSYFKQIFDNASSPYHAFVEECCDVGEEYSELKDSIYSAASLWLAQNGHREIAKNQLSIKLAAVNSQIDHTTRMRIGGERKQVYRGIRLKNSHRTYLISQGISLPSTTSGWAE